MQQEMRLTNSPVKWVADSEWIDRGMLGDVEVGRVHHSANSWMITIGKQFPYWRRAKTPELCRNAVEKGVDEFLLKARLRPIAGDPA